MTDKPSPPPPPAAPSQGEALFAGLVERAAAIADIEPTQAEVGFVIAMLGFFSTEQERDADGLAVALAEIVPRLRALIQKHALPASSAREEWLAHELKRLADSAEAYMNYHNEKFYGHFSTKPTGLWPAIAEARKALEER